MVYHKFNLTVLYLSKEIYTSTNSADPAASSEFNERIDYNLEIYRQAKAVLSSPIAIWFPSTLGCPIFKHFFSYLVGLLNWAVFYDEKKQLSLKDSLETCFFFACTTKNLNNEKKQRILFVVWLELLPKVINFQYRPFYNGSSIFSLKIVTINN